MRRNGQTPGHPGWWIASGVGLLLFVFIQVFPMFGGTDAGNARPLSRAAAEKAALAAAASRFGVTARPSDVVLTHLSDSAAVGYFAKENLLDRYGRQWSGDYPTDVYRADFPQAGGGKLTLFLHLETGKLVAWRDSGEGTPSADGMSKPAPEAAAALRYAEAWGASASDWKWDGQPADPEGKWTYVSRKEKLGGAGLVLQVRVPSVDGADGSAAPAWKGGSVEYKIRVPAEFSSYLDRQKRMAAWMNGIGFALPQLALFVLAIIYAALRHSYTTFLRGIGLSAAFFVLYAAFYLNMIPGFRAQLLDEGLDPNPAGVYGILIVNMIILVGMALFTYFAAVGGDGLWRSMGRPLWPRWREQGFGRTVVSGMKTGYPLAFLLLGVQSVILAGLGQGIGMFQSTDAGQSSANMLVPWLLLLLAWCAGISEELQSRLFGIGLFRHWLVGGAKRLLGRQPSPRAEAILTAAAMLPPGLVWAFGHAGYAVYPAYARLIELVIMGMLLGWFLIRFGLIAVMFAHIILNSALMSVQMLSDGLPGDLPAGIIGLVLPAIVAFGIGAAHRLFRGGTA